MTYIFSTKTFLEAIRGIQVFTNKRSQFYYSRAPSGETYNSILLLALLVLQGFVYGLLYFYFSKVFPGRH
uniref:Uncharacterized protein n=1 Tax=Megaselia scalaris TaxID=36166 RepID=T1GGL3_MEGSC